MALFLGLAAVNLVQPGEGMTARARRANALPPEPADRRTIIEHVFPSSIIDAMARGDVLQIVVFSFLFGAACAAIGAKAKPVVAFCESLAQVMFRYTNYVMYWRRWACAAAMAVTVGEQGSSGAVGTRQAGATLYAAQIVFVAWCWDRS